jgi:hypothetical protein
LLYGKSGNHKFWAMTGMCSGGLLKEFCVPA